MLKNKGTNVKKCKISGKTHAAVRHVGGARDILLPAGQAVQGHSENSGQCHATYWSQEHTSVNIIAN